MKNQVYSLSGQFNFLSWTGIFRIFKSFFLINVKLILNISFRWVEQFKEFEPGLKYGWFHLKLYYIFQDLSRRSIETGFWGFETRLKFIKFGLWLVET